MSGATPQRADVTAQRVALGPQLRDMTSEYLALDDEVGERRTKLVALRVISGFTRLLREELSDAGEICSKRREPILERLDAMCEAAQ